MSVASQSVSSSARSSVSSRDRLPTLTGLRWWAALLVVTYHLTSQVGPVEPVSTLVQFGRSGVTFFFVLSGFVLAWTYLDRPTGLGVFLWRRFARLWPLLAVTAVLSLLVYAALGTEVPAVQAATTFVFLQAFRVDWASGANPAAWSLSAEAFFYVCFPLLLVVAARARALLWVAVVVTIPVLWWVYVDGAWSHWALDYFPPSRLVQFALGVACAVAMRRGRRAPVGYWAAVTLVVAFHAAMALWAVAVPALAEQNGPYSGSQWWSAPFFALLIMAAADRDREGRPTGARGSWSLRLGHWSYALYLVHEVVIRLWVAEVPVPSGPMGVAATWVLLLVLTTAVAALLYTWVEHPAERRLRALLRPRQEGSS